MKRRDLLVKLLETCCSKISIPQLHSQCLKVGLAHDSFVVTKLNVLYARYASLCHAHKLFEETPCKTVYLWNALLRSYFLEGKWVETLSLFHKMNADAITEERPDNYTVSIALKSCSGLQKLELGKMIHGFLKKKKIDNDMFVGSALIELYSKCGQMNDAVKVFTEYPKQDVVLWTSIITGYEQNGSPELALAFFSRMVVLEQVSPDPVTLVSAASACAQLSDFNLGRSVHGFVKRRGFDTKLCLANSILNLYGKTGSIRSAANLFREMPYKDIISWSSMVACYADNGAETNALNLFNEMIDKRIELNRVTVISALRACASSSNLEEGKHIHKLAVNYGFELDITVSTALMDMYMKCFSPKNAIDLFNRMPKKDVVSWAVLFSGYAEIGMAHKSLGVFCNMLSYGTRPDAIALVKILAASSELGIVQQALCLHAFVSKSGFDNNEFIGASLIELYAKCSSIDNANKVFKGMRRKDVVTWSSIIAAYGFHGQGEEALKLFYQMSNHSDVKPNDVTFVSILSACSHAGLIEEGIKMFHVMVNEYQLMPNTEHYGIMVDLLGRMGELDKALDMINEMPMQAGPHVWGALLGACRIHQNIKIGELAALNLFLLDPNHAGYYTLLSNIYCVDKNWHDAAKLRTLIKENRFKKIVGQSMVEIKNEVHSFIASDRFHGESDQIYGMLRKLDARMREEGWVGFLPPCCHVLFYGYMVMYFGVRLWFPVRDFRSSVVEGLCNFMVMIPDKIRSIDGSKETLKLAVRITDLWFIGTPNKSEQAEMVFVDSEGDQIHAICKSNHLKSWKADLKENCTYVMHNFKVVENDECEHEYKLFFIGVTVVREADLHELPFKEFRFAEFANVVASNFVSGLLVDIIGVVDQVVFRHVSSKNTRVVFRIKDLSGEILSCTLWENYWTQFLSYLNERGDDGPMVIILTHARIKDAQGSYPASVSNSFKASKLLINDPILEIQEFKERLLDLGVEMSPVLLPGDQANSQDVVYVTMGTISKIVMDNHSWCYPACVQCHRKTDIQTGPFTCGCGKENNQPVLRVEVMVTQNNKSSKFLLWDRECAELIGETADDVNRVKIEDGDLDLNSSPQALDKLLGHVLAFKACSKIDPSNVDCNNATHAECNYQHAKRSDSAKARINRKRIMQQKRHGHAQSSSQPTLNCTSEYNMTVSDSSESENSESTQGYSDLGDQLIQCRYCNAQIQYSGIQNHIVSALSHMLDQHNSHAKSFRMARDRLAGDQANNIKLQLIAARGKDGCVYNMPNVPEIVALIVGNFHPGSKRDIIVETQNGELQRIHELHPSYLPLQYPLLFPYGEDGYRADILHRCTSSSKKRKRNRLTMRKWFAYRLQSRSNEAQTLLHSRKLFQQFIVEGYTMVESERLSYIRNNQNKLRVDKYSSLQTSLDTGTAKGLTKGKRVILPSMFVGSPCYMDQLYFDGMTICSHVGFPNLFITLTCNPSWPEIRRLLSPLNLKPTDRPDIVSRIFRLKYEHMLSDLTKGQLLGKINDDTLRNLTLIEIEQLLHINQRSLKDYPTILPINADELKTIYHKIIQAVNNNEGGMLFLYGFGGTGKTFIWRTLASSLRAENQIPLYYYQEAELHIPDLKFLYQFLKTQYGQSLSMVGLYLPKPVFTHGQLYVALSRVNSAKGLKILIHDDEQKSMNSTTNVVYKEVFRNIKKKPKMSISSSTASTRIRYPIVRPPAIIQFRAAFHNDQEIPSHARKYLKQCKNHLTILRKNAPPLQWDVVTLDRDIKDKSIVWPWYKFLRKNDFHHGDEVSFYYRPHERIWEIVIRRERKWL
ncbi:putative pentatricopeptide repeat-containing protein [Glycine soja]